MPTQFPTAKLLVNATAVITTGNSGTLNLPQAPAYVFILDISSATGTSPTCDVALQISPDDGTTWYTVSRYAQVTGTAVKSFKMIRNGLSTGEAGYVQAIADTGGAVDKDVVFTRKIRVLYTVAGTNPNYATLKVWCIPQPTNWNQ